MMASAALGQSECVAEIRAFFAQGLAASANIFAERFEKGDAGQATRPSFSHRSDTMTTINLVDPELVPPSGQIPSPNFRMATLPEVRAGMLAKAIAALPAESPSVLTETVSVPGLNGAPDVRVLAYRPAHVQGALPVLLHLHGGGYVVGSPERKGAEHRKLAVDLACAIYSADYRLAPETPFPGSIDDCYAVVQWLHSNARQAYPSMPSATVAKQCAVRFTARTGSVLVPGF